MKRKQKRFTKEDQLIQSIDRYREKAVTLLEQAFAEDRAADSCLAEITKLEGLKNAMNLNKIKPMINKARYDWEKHKEESKKLNKSRNRILESTLPRYGQALSAFRTEVLAFTDDKGLVLQ